MYVYVHIYVNNVCIGNNIMYSFQVIGATGLDVASCFPLPASVSWRTYVIFFRKTSI